MVLGRFFMNANASLLQKLTHSGCSHTVPCDVVSTSAALGAHVVAAWLISLLNQNIETVAARQRVLAFLKRNNYCACFV
jgi:hypothetical protein